MVEVGESAWQRVLPRSPTQSVIGGTFASIPVPMGENPRLWSSKQIILTCIPVNGCKLASLGDM